MYWTEVHCDVKTAEGCVDDADSPGAGGRTARLAAEFADNEAAAAGWLWCWVKSPKYGAARRGWACPACRVAIEAAGPARR